MIDEPTTTEINNADESPQNYTRAVFQKGMNVFVEGEPGDIAYVIQSGKVEVLKGHVEQTSLGFREKGETIGEMALFSDMPRAATVVARENTVVLGISKEAFAYRMETMDPAMRSIMGNLVARLREVSTHLVMKKEKTVWAKRG